MNIIEYSDVEMMMIDLANQLAGELSMSLMNHDTVSFAVPGGTTPGPLFDTLSGADLHWNRIHVMLTDERWVPEDHDRSNTRLLRERLLTGRAAMAEFVPICDGSEVPEDAIDRLAAGVMPELPISVLLLGMGTDGHIASLFPGADRLNDALRDNAPPLMAMRAPDVPEPRVTLTAPVLKGAIHTHILITGAEKRAVLERARRQAAQEAPVRLVLGNATVHWAE